MGQEDDAAGELSQESLSLQIVVGVFGGGLIDSSSTGEFEELDDLLLLAGGLFVDESKHPIAVSLALCDAVGR